MDFAQMVTQIYCARIQKDRREFGDVWVADDAELEHAKEAALSAACLVSAIANILTDDKDLVEDLEQLSLFTGVGPRDPWFDYTGQMERHKNSDG